MGDRVLVDTSVLIPLFNEGKFQDRILELNANFQLFVSIVTANELLRGAHDAVSKNIVEEFLEILQGRLVTPAEKHWIECATLSERLLKEKRRSKQNILLMQNDLLIAIGARETGARLVTSDRKDFALIQPYVRGPIEFW